ncbi:LysR substrate-binding domain-containing protein [Shimwellia blattae]|uniref:Putative transcriptional regulator YahB n=1 Tax=Shimwellia blattae (strain ATCC 29907 / DSM 4481 / JCM 1650 / NBRC 105725 / CDC 9005-74) TaxID=630626 RepID=I2B683_SHIBC|nr:LysR substrate-binding domain-containing protein [Shimwellia blattae]AFJ46037.1 putative transcriptional regulator YahB [Shimwellia blattae DSM 4481 = NBRC 105725]GAB82685.1 putative LysR family transcriptional regulator YahB [Shimwellia blattae DSM 4481 = NBRC 105725]VDY63510.1 HTH-type transcriptional activator AllS [Shimwellia blattae]VEC21477.1 HTH-type transcriptional activator AllS [Shimwellia blattae]
MHSIFTEENLLTFCAAARCGSFSKAAIELGLTTSAVSYAIKRLEAGLDATLFTRNTRHIELTEAGGYFYRKATELLNHFDDTRHAIDTIARGVEARVRICINQLLYTPQHTARLLQVLKQHFPTSQITIISEVYNGVWDAFINHQVNIAIGAPDTLLSGGGIDYTDIGVIRWVFAIAPDHPLARLPEPLPEHLLRQYPNIMVEDTAHTINKKVGWLLHGQESILVPDFNTKCQCQIQGDGIGFLPEYMARNASEAGRLVMRKIRNPRQDSPMLLASRRATSGYVTQWIRQQFLPGGILAQIYRDLLHPQGSDIANKESAARKRYQGN